MTNNPRKVATLEKHGVKVVERVPVRSPSQPENHHYLATKALKLGHQMDWLPEYIPPKSE
jgi:GTP cyclohydrolase II